MNSILRTLLRLLLGLMLLASALAAQIPAEAEDIYVKAYVRKDGTYVAPHYRSAPDGNFHNNWSTRGNVNPYTGEVRAKGIADKSAETVLRLLAADVSQNDPAIADAIRRFGTASAE